MAPDDEPEPEREDRQCRIPGCRARVELPKVFCGRHWKFLSMSERRGLCNVYGLPEWAREFHKCRMKIKQRDPELP